jgi:hypothetical protein
VRKRIQFTASEDKKDLGRKSTNNPVNSSEDKKDPER